MRTFAAIFPPHRGFYLPQRPESLECNNGKRQQRPPGRADGESESVIQQATQVALDNLGISTSSGSQAGSQYGQQGRLYLAPAVQNLLAQTASRPSLSTADLGTGMQETIRGLIAEELQKMMQMQVPRPSTMIGVPDNHTVTVSVPTGGRIVTHEPADVVMNNAIVNGVDEDGEIVPPPPPKPTVPRPPRPMGPINPFTMVPRPPPARARFVDAELVTRGDVYPRSKSAGARLTSKEHTWNSRKRQRTIDESDDDEEDRLEYLQPPRKWLEEREQEHMVNEELVRQARYTHDGQMVMPKCKIFIKPMDSRTSYITPQMEKWFKLTCVDQMRSVEKDRMRLQQALKPENMVGFVGKWRDNPNDELRPVVLYLTIAPFTRHFLYIPNLCKEVMLQDGKKLETVTLLAMFGLGAARAGEVLPPMSFPTNSTRGKPRTVESHVINRLLEKLQRFRHFELVGEHVPMISSKMPPWRTDQTMNDWVVELQLDTADLSVKMAYEVIGTTWHVKFQDQGCKQSDIRENLNWCVERYNERKNASSNPHSDAELDINLQDLFSGYKIIVTEQGDFVRTHEEDERMEQLKQSSYRWDTFLRRVWKRPPVTWHLDQVKNKCNPIDILLDMNLNRDQTAELSKHGAWCMDLMYTEARIRLGSLCKHAVYLAVENATYSAVGDLILTDKQNKALNWVGTQNESGDNVLPGVRYRGDILEASATIACVTIPQQTVWIRMLLMKIIEVEKGPRGLQNLFKSHDWLDAPLTRKSHPHLFALAAYGNM